MDSLRLGRWALIFSLTFASGATPARAQCADTLPTPRGGAAATSVEGLALIGGGWSTEDIEITSDVVDLYDSSSHSWSRARLSARRTYLAAAATGQRALFAGGVYMTSDSPITFTSDVVDIYDAGDGTWATAHLSQPRRDLSAAAVGDLALFAGGRWGGPYTYDDSQVVDVYDAATGTWSTAELSQARSRPAATSAGSKVLFAGGRILWDESDVVDIYDAANGTWSTAALSEPRADLAAAGWGSRAWFAGGCRREHWILVPSDVVDVYDSATDTWSTARLSQARWGLAATAVDGLVIFAGGRTAEHSGDSDFVDIFDTASGMWSTARLSDARVLPTATTAGDVALIAGGGKGGGVCASLDLFIAGYPRRFCAGDGSAAPCPCGNPGAPGEGCANSTGAGATLSSSGCHRAAAQDLRLDVAHLPPGQALVLFCGASATGGGRGAVLGDGLRCVGEGAVRGVVTRSSYGGTASFAGELAGGAPGEERRYQVWYRDAKSGPCGSGFNLTNGLRVEFAP